jgi:hypothetical protein
MKKYQHLHWWMLLPFAIVFAGFIPNYWSRFTEAKFVWHVHGLSATLWFALLIVQPWLATTGKIRQHRRWGMVGILLAGIVAGSALVRIPSNLEGAAVPGDFAKAPDSFLYGVSLLDLLGVLGFATSVAMGVLRAKKRDDHEMWMISTVFWSMMAGMTRLALTIGNSLAPEGVVYSHLNSVAWGNIPMSLAILLICYRLRNWHPAMIAVLVVNSLYFFLEPIGNSPTWRHIADVLFRYA